MTTALYRRYRPDTFAEMIGQEHVTGPLMQALRSGRVNHAYLFSGPRGCGKTTSARILARTLNCHRNTPETPIDTPCGECPSCVELARGGPGSLDVVEIDAASHNGVDDARDLRERATYAPARDRFKIFILDEAHMVTPQGFNALLKIVEEPPPHIKFVFATTEPDKVIGTIRSRTHHYPFRLVPPEVLSPYLEKLCSAEGVEVGAGVLPLVTRAGGGSVRDSLSVMDQLIAGAADGEVGYDLAVGLLGYTHATLLDDVVDALAARDGASIFRVVDQIIATGHEPRRFVEDVLERLRDLIVIGVSGEAADAVLRELPADQLERMRAQAGRLGVAELSRAADLVNAALTEMTGATSPRLHLELLCARLLLPGADDGAAGLAARIDRLERGGIVTGGGGAVAGGADHAGTAAAEPAGGGAAAGRSSHAAAGGLGGAAAGGLGGAAAGGGLSGAAAARAVVEATRGRKGDAGAGGAVPSGSVPGTDGGSEPGSVASVASSASDPGAAATAPEPPAPAAARSADVPVASGETAAPGPVAEDHVQDSDTGEAPAPGTGHAQPSETAVTAAAPAEPENVPAAGPPGGMTTEEVRRRWPEVLETLASARVTWSLVGQNAQVSALDGGVLRLAFRADGLARAFSNPRHTKAVEDAVYQTLGLQVKVEGIVGGGPDGGAGPGGGPGGPAAPGDAPSGVSGRGGSTGPRVPATVNTPVAAASSSNGTRASAGGGPVASAGSASGQADDSSDDDGGWPAVPTPGRQAAIPAADGIAQDGQVGGGAGVAATAAVVAGAAAVAVADRTAEAAAPWADSVPPSAPAAVPGAPGGDPATSSAGASSPDAPAPSVGTTPSDDDVVDPGATSYVPAAPSDDDEPLPEPPPDYDEGYAPEPVRPAPSRRPAPAVHRDPTPDVAYAPAGGRNLTGAERAREALRQAQAARGPAPEQGHSGGAGGTAPTRSPAATYEELSADDPDIAGGNGLVGVPLVVKVLGGTIIEETVEQA
ncbi:DNA polymerase III subunit gamma and tau [Myceligenerans crystallogenes]|uniref:DNA-directed DNA polymerase n=1 Tax=Myceligenerans crystallogenes TaxID=316335 RepID=A0ABN2NA89_9MICO